MDKSKKEPSCEGLTEEEIDETLAETFPASDPPSWTLGIDNHCEEQQGQSANASTRENTTSKK